MRPRALHARLALAALALGTPAAAQSVAALFGFAADSTPPLTVDSAGLHARRWAAALARTFAPVAPPPPPAP